MPACGGPKGRGVTDGIDPPFRREVLCRINRDGSLDLLDLLFDRLIRVAPEHAAAWRARDPQVHRDFDTLHLFESPLVDELRAKVIAARAAEPSAPPPAPPIAEVNWHEALSWPDLVSPAWKDPERLRRRRSHVKPTAFHTSDSTAMWCRATSACFRGTNCARGECSCSARVRADSLEACWAGNCPRAW